MNPVFVMVKINSCMKALYDNAKPRFYLYVAQILITKFYCKVPCTNSCETGTAFTK